MAQPETYDDWWELVDAHKISSEKLITDKATANQGYFHVGLAAEAALKAYICKKERFNRWPDRKSDPDLYTHNLWKLFKRSGIVIPTGSYYAPSWHVILQWERQQGYDCERMPKKVAESFFDAAFGEYGVVEWLHQN